MTTMNNGTATNNNNNNASRKSWNDYTEAERKAYIDQKKADRRAKRKAKEHEMVALRKLIRKNHDRLSAVNAGMSKAEMIDTINDALLSIEFPTEHFHKLWGPRIGAPIIREEERVMAID